MDKIGAGTAEILIKLSLWWWWFKVIFVSDPNFLSCASTFLGQRETKTFKFQAVLPQLAKFIFFWGGVVFHKVIFAKLIPSPSWAE